MTPNWKTTNLRWLTCAVLIAGLILTLLPAAGARAATITVTTTADDTLVNGNCTLREAIRAANTDAAVDACPKGSGADTIIVPAGTYTLSVAGAGEDAGLTGDLDISSDLTLDGAGRATTTIDGGGLDRVIHVLTGTVVIRQVTLTGGDSGSAFGGGIRMDNGNLKLEAARVTGNGGNVAGIDAEHGTLTLASSRIDSNNGASAGGLNLAAQVQTTIVDSEISDNHSTGDFGGLLNSGTLTVTNSTISGNSAQKNGGGLGNIATASLYNVTVAHNTADVDNDGVGDGGGVYLLAGDTFSAFNSIFGNNSGQLENDCFSADPIPASQFNFNLLEDTAGCTPLSGSGSTNLFGQAPKLGPLAFNGGGLRTQALLAGSPAIDAGGPLQCLDGDNLLLTTDQRGFARPIDGDGNGSAVCDMGAYEYLSPGVPTATPSPTATATATQTATPTATPTCAPGPDSGCATPAPNQLYLPAIQR